MTVLPTVDQALDILLAGNKRYLTGKMDHPHQNPKRRLALSDGQTPIAAILGCADSRVPPAIIFDQGLGDLFVIRVAGNVIDNGVLGSLEYASAKLQVPLIVVLGHARCGAVEATLAGGELPGHLAYIAQAIQPAVERIKNQPGNPLDNAIRTNARLVADQLHHNSSLLAHRAAAGQLKIVSAYYHLESGLVEIL